MTNSTSTVANGAMTTQTWVSSKVGVISLRLSGRQLLPLGATPPLVLLQVPILNFATQRLVKAT